jgi:hypothetical protein
MLREAAEQGDSEGCKRLLDYFLSNLGIRLPKGVLVPFRWTPGRPKETERIHEEWIAKGRPVLNWRVCDELAKTFYPEEFARAQANASLRKRLPDRVRATILDDFFVAHVGSLWANGGVPANEQFGAARTSVTHPKASQ